jgi:hypothetical protein
MKPKNTICLWFDKVAHGQDREIQGYAVSMNQARSLVRDHRAR